VNNPALGSLADSLIVQQLGATGMSAEDPLCDKPVKECPTGDVSWVARGKMDNSASHTARPVSTFESTLT